MDCLKEDEAAFAFFNELPGSHRKYFIKWKEGSKTEPTRVIRIAQMVNACSRGLRFNEMSRSL
jgi:uncharacterized protein YdeI (YjbR/CyaY-like superfamily)